MTSRRRRSGRHVLLAPAGAVALAVAVLAGCSGTTSSGAPSTTPPVFSTPSSSAAGTPGTGASSTTAGSSAATAAAAPSSTAGNGRLTAKIKLSQIGTFDNPTAMTARPGSTTLYVAEQPGRLRSIHVTDDGRYSVDSALPLDLHTEVGSGGERGFLGIAFSTDGNTLYTYFTDPDGRIHLVKWTMNGDTVDLASRRELLTLQHDRVNHNGGQLQVGPDGFLYVGVGDGGGGGDPDHNGQNTGTLYGKILRIDPSKPGADGKPYAIPADNPFATGGGAPEVWLYGARNPWRFSFDTDGDLWVADVGQDLVEEIDHLPATDGKDAGRGANLGWNQMEGSRPYNNGTPPANSVLPVFEYSHEDGACSIIGGSVYRGKKVPALAGVYLYGDYCVPDIRGLLVDGGKVVDDASLGASVDQLTTFGVDNDHEVYAFGQGDQGKMYAVTPG